VEKQEKLSGVPLHSITTLNSVQILNLGREAYVEILILTL
jgi:hypothetical protein